MSAEEFSRYDSMKLFLHQIYEFQKGVRSLVLCTMCRTCASLLSERLERLGIAYRIQSVTDSKVNLYFGNRMCLETVATFIHKPRRISCSARCSATTSPGSANVIANESLRVFHQNKRRSTDRRLFLPDLRRERIPRADTVGHFDVRRGDVRHAVRSEYMASDGAAGEYHGTESVFFEQVAALRLYAEHPAYDGQLLVVCFQNIAAAERVVDHLRRIEMLPQVDVEDLIMSRCAKNGTAEKPQSRFFAVALRYSVSKSCDSLCPFSSTRSDTIWRCSLEMSLCLKTI